ncbi:MAG: DUF423 domain-containing protein [Chromatiales bacterium]|nr:DUF423 domain-containing protein [Chromatiales bacterium]
MIIGSLSLLVAVQLSALGAHALTSVLTPQKLNSWIWATQMQIAHSLGLLLIGLLITRFGAARLLVASGVIMTLGLLLFSGSIYIDALGGPGIFARIPPLGGSSFMIAWLLLAIALFRLDSTGSGRQS